MSSGLLLARKPPLTALSSTGTPTLFMSLAATTSGGASGSAAATTPRPVVMDSEGLEHIELRLLSSALLHQLCQSSDGRAVLSRNLSTVLVQTQRIVHWILRGQWCPPPEPSAVPSVTPGRFARTRSDNYRTAGRGGNGGSSPVLPGSNASPREPGSSLPLPAGSAGTAGGASTAVPLPPPTTPHGKSLRSALHYCCGVLWTVLSWCVPGVTAPPGIPLPVLTAADADIACSIVMEASSVPTDAVNRSVMGALASLACIPVASAASLAVIMKLQKRIQRLCTEETVGSKTHVCALGCLAWAFMNGTGGLFRYVTCGSVRRRQVFRFTAGVCCTCDVRFDVRAPVCRSCAANVCGWSAATLLWAASSAKCLHCEARRR